MTAWADDRLRRRRSIVIAASVAAGILMLLLAGAAWIASSLLGWVTDAAPAVVDAVSAELPAFLRWLEGVLPGAADFLQRWAEHLPSWTRG